MMSPGDSPVIGISCYAQPASWGSWQHVQANLLPRRYADAVATAGGVPVLLPPLPGISGALDRLDGLILSGGGDIDPAHYSAGRHERTDPANAARDDAEFGLCRAALAAGLPLLGICRGLQIINVVLGGTLHQHLPDVVGHAGHAPKAGSYGSHQVSLTPGSWLEGALGRTELAVPTHHHQAIDSLGAGLVATAWTADGIIEAVELGQPDSPAGLVIAVQWHPEAGEDRSLFDGLVAAARQRAAQPAYS